MRDAEDIRAANIARDRADLPSSALGLSAAEQRQTIPATDAADDDDLTQRVQRLEREVEHLRGLVRQLSVWRETADKVLANWGPRGRGSGPDEPQRGRTW